MGKKSRKILNVIITTVICLSVAFCVTGCGGETENKVSMDPEALANYILNNVQFDADMEQVRKDSIGTVVELPEDRTGYMFLGDGSHSDGFGVFTFSSDGDAKTAEKSIKSYLKEVEDSFSRYIPEEADKVKNHSFIIRDGADLIYVISKDENAEDLVKKFLNGEVVQETGTPEETPDTEDPAEEPADEDEPEDEGEPTDEPVDETEEEDETSTDIDLSKYPTIETKSKLKYNGYVGMIGKSAYEIFDYVDSAAENYAKVVNYTKKKLGDDVNVYDMLIPLSSGITVPDKYYFEIHGSNQKKSIENVYAKLKNGVIPVRMFDNLMKHRNEYVYFRTDHHWTSLGAYYGYESWCKASGTLPISLDKRKKENYGDFVGAFYNDTNSKKLLENPDTLEAYFPVGEVYTKKKDYAGNKYKADIITDMSNSSKFYKYQAFINGDQPSMTIYNDSVNDDSVLIIVKESFGNCLVPYLADHYHKTYVLDYRYTKKNIVEFAKEKGANDIIFVNNIGMTRSGYLIGLLEKAVKDN